MPKLHLSESVKLWKDFTIHNKYLVHRLWEETNCQQDILYSSISYADGKFESII